MSLDPFVDEISHPVLVLVGPTAVGKTSLSLEMAEKFNCEIISMDSMQVYRHMDIGTAKVSQQEQQKIKHHLIDIRNPDEQYDASLFVRDARTAIRNIIQKNKVPLITGGTGMYLNSLVHGLFQDIEVDQTVRESVDTFFAQRGREAAYKKLQEIDPDTAARVHKNDTQRVKRGLEIYQATGKPWSKHLLEQKNAQQITQFPHLICMGIRCERELLHQRIALRTQQMIDAGFITEVDKLLQMGYDADLASMQSIGYRQMVQFLAGLTNLEQAVEEIIVATRRYAKRQFTWFNRNESLVWFEKGEEGALLGMAEKKIKEARNSLP